MIVVVSTLGYYKVLLLSGDRENTCDLQDGENIYFSTSTIQRRRLGSAVADYKVHLYECNFLCVLYVNREEESRRLVKSLQRQLIEVKREKESEIQVSQVYLQYTHQMYIYTITFKTNEI